VNDTAREVPPATIAALFGAQVARDPSPRLLFEESGCRTGSWTAGNRLAHELVPGSAARSGVAVALAARIDLVSRCWPSARLGRICQVIPSLPGRADRRYCCRRQPCRRPAADHQSMPRGSATATT